jgi:hypothetical protein
VLQMKFTGGSTVLFEGTPIPSCILGGTFFISIFVGLGCGPFSTVFNNFRVGGDSLPFRSGARSRETAKEARAW